MEIIKKEKVLIISFCHGILKKVREIDPKIKKRNQKMKIVFLLALMVFALYLWYVFLIIYHLIRFGIGKEPKLASLVFFLGSGFLLILAFFYFSRVDWQEILNFIFEKLKSP